MDWIVEGAERVIGTEHLELGAASLSAERGDDRPLHNLDCRTVDVVLTEGGAGAAGRLLDGLVAELLADRREREVALRGKNRWVRELRPLPWDAGSAPRPGDGALSSSPRALGGAAGALAQALAERPGIRLVVVEAERREPQNWSRQAGTDESTLEALVRRGADIEGDAGGA